MPLCLLLFFAVRPAEAVQPPRAARPGVPVGITRLVQRAGYIFSGTVTDVRASAAGAQVPTIQITFRVEEAIRGVAAGQVLVIREWAGLWTAAPRYRRGERLLLFLYRPSRLGLTSPVSGALGRFAVDPSGQVTLEPQHLAVLSSDPVVAPRVHGKNQISMADFSLAIHRAAGE